MPASPRIRRLIACLVLSLFSLLLQPGIAADQPAPAAEADVDEIVKNPVKADPAAEKFWAAVRLLQSQKPADLVAGRAALQAVADQEYAHAQVLLGNCLASGSYGFTKDARKAANLFRLAAERGNAFAKVSLGSCYATGTGVRKDDIKAAEWLTAALAAGADYSQPDRPAPTPGMTDDRLGANVAGELGNDPVSTTRASAHFLLAQILVRQNKTVEAHTHYEAAATAGLEGRSGLYAAATQAALNYAFGQGVPRDMAKANEMLDRSRRLIARQQISLIHNYVSLKMVDDFAVADLEEQAGEAGASQQSQLQVNIATMLGNKKSKDYNPAEAVKWYELAAENGQIWAMLQLGTIYAKGELGSPDLAKAFFWFEKVGGGPKPKHYLGIANLAICYQNGLGTERDPAKAAALFKKHRETDIICYLGSIGQCPPAPVSFEEATALNETWAKQKNDPTAQYLLGLRYLYGWGVKADRDDAVKWLQKAGKVKHGGALCMLGLLAENTQTNLGGIRFTSVEDLQRAADYYRQGSQAGNIDATANYANLLQSGRGIAKDLALAEATYLKCLALDPEHARAQCNLAVLYEQRLREFIDTIDGERIAHYRGLMLKHYEAAVRLEFPFAATNLATLYHEGKLVPQDYRKAYGLFEQAVEWGQPVVHYQLGHMHEHGQGVPVTLTEAAYHYRLAALEGHEEALRRLVNFYLTGTGVSLSLDRAAFWMLQLARRGNPGVLPNYCDILLRQGDYATLVPMLREMTKQTNQSLAGYGYDRLSLCYLRGLGVKANPARAQKYFDTAIKLGNSNALTELAMQQMKRGKIAEGVATFHRAANGSPDANYALGQMYYLGTNVPQDKDKGLKFILTAARGNQVNALFFLAALTYKHEPNAPVLDDAIRYAQQAENIGHPQAAEVREMLEKRRQDKAAAPEEATRARTL